MGKGAYDAKRGDAFWFDPNDVIIEEEDHNPLFDERTKTPVDEGLVNSILYERQGVLLPIVVRKVGGEPYVVDGRQRVKAAREANKRLKDQGAEPLLVPAVNWRGDDKAAMSVMISANEHRLEDSVLVKAQKLGRYLNQGGTNSEASVNFGVSLGTISNWLKLLELDDKVKKLVESGRLSATVAAELHDLPREEQITKADELAESNSTVAMVREEKRTKQPAKKRKRIRTKKEIESALKEYMEIEDEYLTSDVIASTQVLEWVLNQREDLPV